MSEHPIFILSHHKSLELRGRCLQCCQTDTCVHTLYVPAVSAGGGPGIQICWPSALTLMQSMGETRCLGLFLWAPNNTHPQTARIYTQLDSPSLRQYWGGLCHALRMLWLLFTCFLLRMPQESSLPQESPWWLLTRFGKSHVDAKKLYWCHCLSKQIWNFTELRKSFCTFIGIKYDRWSKQRHPRGRHMSMQKTLIEDKSTLCSSSW